MVLETPHSSLLSLNFFENVITPYSRLQLALEGPLQLLAQSNQTVFHVTKYRQMNPTSFHQFQGNPLLT